MRDRSLPDRGRHFPTTPLLLAAAATLALGANPAAASVAQIGADGYLDVTETTPGEKNDLYIKVLPKDPAGVTIEITDFAAGITPGAGCWKADWGVQCSDPPQSMRVNLGGGDDKFGVSESGTPMPFSGGVVANLGPGNGIYDASVTNASITINGGEGNDRFEGSLNTDHIDGGPGDDDIYGGPGTDDLHGGPGNDALHGDTRSDKGVFADVLDGGEGRDTLDDYIFDGDAPRLRPSPSRAGQALPAAGQEGDAAHQRRGATARTVTLKR